MSVLPLQTVVGPGGVMTGCGSGLMVTDASASMLEHPLTVVEMRYCKVTGPVLRFWTVPVKVLFGAAIDPLVVVVTPVGSVPDKVQV